MKPAAHTCPSAGGGPSGAAAARSSSGRAASRPRQSITAGARARSSSSASTGACSAARSCDSRASQCMLKCVRSASLPNTSAPPGPNSAGSHSSCGTARRMHSSAVIRPSQNSHCGVVSGWRSRSASSASSSASSVAEVASSRSSSWGVAGSVMGAVG